MIENIYQLLEYADKNYAERAAFRYVKDDAVCTITYREFATDVRRTAAYLIEEFSGMQGRHIAILARNSYRYIVTMLGIMLSGGVAVFLNTEENWNTICEQIVFSDAEALFTDEAYLSGKPECREQFCDILYRMEDCMCGDISVRPMQTDVNDEIALLMFTSGTTSTSKCVMLQNKSLWNNIKSFLPDENAKNCFFTIPLYHIGGICVVLGWLAFGCSIGINSSIKYLKQELNLLQCEHAFLVPAVIRFLYRYLKKEKQLGGRIQTIITGTAKIEKKLLDNVNALGIRVIQTYGLSESGAKATTNLSRDPRRSGSVGTADTGSEIKIENNEICIKGDCVMLGYYKNPEATAEAIVDGWLHTGDLGYLDEDGYLYLTGRKKNLIILATGENVSPEELETLLLRSPDIEEAVVREKDNCICAELFCGNAEQAAVLEYVEAVNRELAYYKHIKKVEFREEPFEKTASGKIKRK